MEVGHPPCRVSTCSERHLLRWGPARGHACWGANEVPCLGELGAPRRQSARRISGPLSCLSSHRCVPEEAPGDVRCRRELGPSPTGELPPDQWPLCPEYPECPVPPPCPTPPPWHPGRAARPPTNTRTSQNARRIARMELLSSRLFGARDSAGGQPAGLWTVFRSRAGGASRGRRRGASRTPRRSPRSRTAPRSPRSPRKRPGLPWSRGACR